MPPQHLSHSFETPSTPQQEPCHPRVLSPPTRQCPRRHLCTDPTTQLSIAPPSPATPLRDSAHPSQIPAATPPRGAILHPPLLPVAATPHARPTQVDCNCAARNDPSLWSILGSGPGDAMPAGLKRGVAHIRPRGLGVYLEREQQDCLQGYLAHKKHPPRRCWWWGTPAWARHRSSTAMSTASSPCTTSSPSASTSRSRFTLAWCFRIAGSHKVEGVVARRRAFSHSLIAAQAQATNEWTGRNVQRFRGGLVFKAHRLCVSLNSRVQSNKEEEEWTGAAGCCSGHALPKSVVLFTPSLLLYYSQA